MKIKDEIEFRKERIPKGEFEEDEIPTDRKVVGKDLIPYSFITEKKNIRENPYERFELKEYPKLNRSEDNESIRKKPELGSGAGIKIPKGEFEEDEIPTDRKVVGKDLIPYSFITEKKNIRENPYERFELREYPKLNRPEDNKSIRKKPELGSEDETDRIRMTVAMFKRMRRIVATTSALGLFLPGTLKPSRNDKYNQGSRDQRRDQDGEIRYDVHLGRLAESVSKMPESDYPENYRLFKDPEVEPRLGATPEELAKSVLRRTESDYSYFIAPERYGLPGSRFSDIIGEKPEIELDPEFERHPLKNYGDKIRVLKRGEIPGYVFVTNVSTAFDDDRLQRGSEPLTDEDVISAFAKAYKCDTRDILVDRARDGETLPNPRAVYVTKAVAERLRRGVMSMQEDLE
ncbi:hypothetical protein ACFL0X_00920 [Nanoarchaeota archaeon]